MFSAYRVIKDFGWEGWQYAESPYGYCLCNCWHRKITLGRTCTHQVGTECACKLHDCFCTCTLKEAQFAGDIWIIQENHPKIERLIKAEFAIYDSSLPPIHKLLEQHKYSRLTVPYGT